MTNSRPTGVIRCRNEYTGASPAAVNPTRELLQKNRVPERAPRRRHRTPAGLDPLLEQPSIVPVDARLDAVRRVPEQRQVEQLGGACAGRC